MYREPQRKDIDFDSALYVRQKKTAFEIQILPTVKFSLHIKISLLSLKNWVAVTRIIGGCAFIYVQFVNVPT